MYKLQGLVKPARGIEAADSVACAGAYGEPYVCTTRDPAAGVDVNRISS
jgi:hypothetical protein